MNRQFIADIHWGNPKVKQRKVNRYGEQQTKSTQVRARG